MQSYASLVKVFLWENNYLKAFMFNIKYNKVSSCLTTNKSSRLNSLIGARAGFKILSSVAIRTLVGT